MRIRECSLLALIIFWLFTSCNKKADPQPLPDPPPVATMNINLSNAGGNIELIFSETGGKVLLDTLPVSGNNLVATLKTNQTLLDVTTIGYDSGLRSYVITTYKAVNPSKWSSINANDYSAPIGSLPDKSKSVFYTHVPVQTSDFTLNDYVGSFSSSLTDLSPGHLGVTYSRHGSNNYLYLLFPISGLYNFHIPKNAADTVDLSNMDTAIIMNFKKPLQYIVNTSTLIGIMDTTDFSRSAILYQTFANGMPDMEYPRKVVQKLEVYAIATNKNKGSFFLYSYGDTIPSTMPIRDESSYTLTSTFNNKFTVSFLSEHPTNYTTHWENTKMRWDIITPTDSTTINPIGLLTSLNSKFLRGQNFSDLSLTFFQFETAQGFDYLGFDSYIHSPELIKTRRLPLFGSFRKLL